MSVDLQPNTSMQKLILMGAGASNLQIASTLFRQKIPGLEMTCIANEEQVLLPPMLPDLVAGKRNFNDCSLPVHKVLERLNVQWIPSKVKGISASSNSIQLESNQTLTFDWLAINTTPLQHRDHIEQTLPGAKKYGFFVYPMELFSKHWNQVCEESQGTALRIAIIGSSLHSMELALAVRQRHPYAAVTLITQADCNSNPSITATTQPAAVLLLQALKEQRVTVLQDVALSCNKKHVQLGCGAQLVCDIPIIALEPQTPAWLTDQHTNIFFHPVASLGQTERICSIISGKPAKKRLISQQQLITYYSGASFGIAQWGDRTMQGRVAGWLKHFRDRQMLQRA